MRSTIGGAGWDVKHRSGWAGKMNVFILKLPRCKEYSHLVSYTTLYAPLIRNPVDLFQHLSLLSLPLPDFFLDRFGNLQPFAL